ncbi:hypothetical protein F5X68DRAFT_272626 [Plectosphaerella plurivora]|uniref:DUF2306 domain-containing protein n=1 Tax=Plectosphaerella plurivora TaxID=936078 RepID=A0A9P8VLG1_9PEZI|nr:hypothetical protein F5X68DRAFT_272626 [Plectosphaerella plurivora]
MGKPTRPAPNGFVRIARKVYNPIGFSKGCNFILFFIFAFAMFIFSLWNTPKINYNTYCMEDGEMKGECFWYEKIALQKVAIIMHLAAILPAGALVCFQFVPVLRHKAMLFHRINGYLVIALSIIGAIGGVIISRHSFGGGLDTQTFAGVATIAFLVSMLIAYINIKRLQIEQHRAWMLRAWFYASSIITTRFVLIIGVSILTYAGYHTARSCEEVAFAMPDQNSTLELFPDCEVYFSGEDPDKWVAVSAKFAANARAGVEVQAILGVMFGPACWIGFIIHAVGIELYLHLTPAEHERLRQISYQRQVKAGMRHPGSAGLTADRLGDAAKWSPRDAPDGMEMDDTSSASLPTTTR